MSDEQMTAADLRRKAEEKVAGSGAVDGELDGIAVRHLLNELQVHQVELEMQNEELCRTVAEKTIRETHLNNIIAQTPAGYFHINLEGYILDVNNAWLRIHGYETREEVVGKHFSMMQVNSESDPAIAHLAELSPYLTQTLL